MKEKIISLLKTKYSNLGFGDKAFDGVADYLSKTVSEESQIETAIDGVEPLLKAFQSDIDKVRTEKSALRTQLEEFKKLQSAEGGKQERTEPNTQLEEFKKLQAWFEKNVKPLQEDLHAYKEKEALSSRQNLITQKAKELGIPDWRLNEGFAIAPDADESTITNYLAGVQKNLITAGLKGSGGFPLAGTGEATKDDVEEILSGMKL